MHVSRTRRQKTTTTINLRNHGWIYCTAIEPTSDEEWRDLKAMMPSEYDHASYIYRARAFALALGSMLADQFGIRGGEVQLDARIADLHASSRRGSQTIFHGPVVYEQDKFARFTSPRNEFEAFLGKIFIKHKRFEAEREYRFVIWSEDEPAEDYVDLRMSLAMREAMLPLITPSRETYPETDPPNSSAPDVPEVPRDLPPAAKLPKLPKLTSHEPALPDPLAGYRRIRIFLRREGHVMSPDRAHRLWRHAGLQVPRRRPRRPGSSGSCIRPHTVPFVRWAEMDRAAAVWTIPALPMKWKCDTGRPCVSQPGTSTACGRAWSSSRIG